MPLNYPFLLLSSCSLSSPSSSLTSSRRPLHLSSQPPSDGRPRRRLRRQHTVAGATARRRTVSSRRAASACGYVDSGSVVRRRGSAMGVRRHVGVASAAAAEGNARVLSSGVGSAS
uniref:Uncharacterized protein n=1 Tax=Oryza sativa subsp. japonica TaxID=39947 RepID=Q7XIA1_ORYSJ|nr:hypothetical protein [Oryza sativa Japonica Group]BAD30486.1 hypothetical protein [Oryza sativa Japonica Group]